MQLFGKRKLVPVIILILVMAGSVLMYPFAPLFYFSMRGNDFVYSISPLISWEDYSARYKTLGSKTILTEYQYEPKEIDGNRLIIPKIGVNIRIVQGQNEDSALSKGAWLIPDTSNPASGSNTVLSAHRFRYAPPHEETFYLLDKLKAGDTFTVYWEGSEYRYRVSDSRVIANNAFEILNSSSKPMVTLLTCSPLFSTKERLAVSAELLGVF